MAKKSTRTPNIVRTDTAPKVYNLNIFEERIKKNPRLDLYTLKDIGVTTLMVEQVMCELIGAIHCPTVNGKDGEKDGRWVESKSQIISRIAAEFNKAFLGRGRAKFGAISFKIYSEKTINNEIEIVACCDGESGDVFAVFQFDFADLAQEYSDAVKKINGKKYSNWDILPKQYARYPSFEVLQVAPVETLKTYKDKLTVNFYNFLSEYATSGKIDLDHLNSRSYRF